MRFPLSHVASHEKISLGWLKIDPKVLNQQFFFTFVCVKVEFYRARFYLNLFMRYDYNYDGAFSFPFEYAVPFRPASFYLYGIIYYPQCALDAGHFVDVHTASRLPLCVLLITRT